MVETNSNKIKNIAKMVHALVENALIEQDIMLKLFTSDELISHISHRVYHKVKENMNNGSHKKSTMESSCDLDLKDIDSKSMHISIQR